MNVFSDVFAEVALLLLLAIVMGALGVRLRQPLIVAFIAAGILVGPSVLGWVHANDQVDLLAKLGITLLLFIVGLKLDLHIIRTMGPVALATGLGQVAFTSIIGYPDRPGAGHVADCRVICGGCPDVFQHDSIAKLLSDKREVDTLHGRIALGFLIVQDLVIVLAMIALNAIASVSVDEASMGFEVLEMLLNPDIA
ncbi:MAG: cation:proton antiporter [Nitrosomonas sp.]|nr:cation:proton antiporter [Nitrosomonas sp.]MDP1950650.1 cation:proton antiporter [Nitrosomonas sp.]